MPKVGYRVMNGLFPAIGFLLLALVVGSSFVLVLYQQQAQRDVVQTVSAVSATYRILSMLQAAETGQRGYLLTHDERYLEPHVSARTTLDQQFDALSQSLDDVGEGQMRATLKILAREKMAELAATVEKARTGDFEDRRD